jgi:hypothetical protein
MLRTSGRRSRAASTDTTINSAGAQGVARAAVEGLYRKLKDDEATKLADRAQIDAINQEVKAQKLAMAAATARFDAVVARLSVEQPVPQAYAGGH